MAEENKGAIRRFSGADNAEYRKSWRKWALARLFGLPTNVDRSAWGPKIYSLLDGDAMEACEGLEIASGDDSDIAVEDGWRKVFAKLDERWPEREDDDKLGDALDEFYEFRTLKNETGEAYCGRVVKLFSKLDKEKVKFPDEAKGHMAARAYGLTKKDRPTLMALTGKKWTQKEILSAIRSGYPNGAPQKQSSAFYAGVENAEQGANSASGDGGEEGPFDDGTEKTYHVKEEMDEELDAILLNISEEECQLDDFVSEEKEIDEPDAVQALLAYKQQRQALNRARLSRGCPPLKDNTSLQDFKKKVKCYGCGQLGHFRKDCPKGPKKTNPPPQKPKGKGKGGGKGSGRSYFVQSVYLLGGISAILGWNRKKKAKEQVQNPENPELASEDDEEDDEQMVDINHVSEPGEAVADIGAGKCLVGSSTLEKHLEKLLKLFGTVLPDIKWVRKKAKFKGFSHGVVTSEWAIQIPIGLKGVFGILEVQVVDGPGKDAPLLLSKKALASLGAIINTMTNVISLTKIGVEIVAREARSGHMLLNLLEFLGSRPTVPNTEPKVVGEEVKVYETQVEETTEETPAPTEPEPTLEELYPAHSLIIKKLKDKETKTIMVAVKAECREKYELLGTSEQVWATPDECDMELKPHVPEHVMEVKPDGDTLVRWRELPPWHSNWEGMCWVDYTALQKEVSPQQWKALKQAAGWTLADTPDILTGEKAEAAPRRKLFRKKYACIGYQKTGACGSDEACDEPEEVEGEKEASVESEPETSDEQSAETNEDVQSTLLNLGIDKERVRLVKQWPCRDRQQVKDASNTVLFINREKNSVFLNQTCLPSDKQSGWVVYFSRLNTERGKSANTAGMTMSNMKKPVSRKISKLTCLTAMVLSLFSGPQPTEGLSTRPWTQTPTYHSSCPEECDFENIYDEKQHCPSGNVTEWNSKMMDLL